MFGNTEAVARAVADALGGCMDVEVHDVTQAPDPNASLVDLVVVGGPTHAFSMSRSSTRVEALSRGATHGNKDVGLREWLGMLQRGPHSELVAAFDTRVDRVRHLPGSAAKKAAKLAHELGYAPAGRESFYVSDVEGPLLAGELDRASAWGGRLGSEMADRALGRPVR